MQYYTHKERRRQKIKLTFSPGLNYLAVLLDVHTYVQFCTFLKPRCFVTKFGEIRVQANISMPIFADNYLVFR